MKKFLAIILALTMIAALCACGKTEAPAETPVPAAETQAPAEEKPAEPEEKEPEETKEIEKIEITAENFLDYFEQVEEPDYENAEKDEDGNIVAMNIKYDYHLKSEYEPAVEQSEEEPVFADFDISYTAYLNPVDVDFEKLSYTLGDDATEQSFSASVTADWWNADGTLCEDPASAEDAVYKMTVLEFPFGLENINALESIEITAAAGTLYLYK